MDDLEHSHFSCNKSPGFVLLHLIFLVESNTLVSGKYVPYLVNIKKYVFEINFSENIIQVLFENGGKWCPGGE
jgi:hypothetical protein